MQRLSVLLREYLPFATKTEQKIIEYVKSHVNEVSQIGIHALSKKLCISASTITRFCRKLGFKSYKDFQKSAIYESLTKKEQLRDSHSEIDKNDSLEQIADKITYQSILSVQDTRGLVDLELLGKAADLLTKCNKICFFGCGASLLVAEDAHLKFIRVDKTCAFCRDFHLQWVQAMNMKPSDVGFIVSYSGQTEEMIQCAGIMKEANIPTIAITGFGESPLSKLTDYNLYVADTEFEFKTGKLSSRISQLVVVDMLYAIYVQKNYDSCMEALKRTQMEKRFENRKR